VSRRRRMYTLPPEGELDLLAAGQTLVDFISVERTDWLRSAIMFRRYLGSSPSNIAVDVAKLGGTSGVSKANIGAFVQFTDSKLQLEFHDLGAKVVIFTSGGGVVKVSDGSTVKQIGPLTRVEVKNVTGARNSSGRGYSSPVSTATAGPRASSSPTRSASSSCRWTATSSAW
jgi:sugar/nucleoside kinase (ribokinase family)